MPTNLAGFTILGAIEAKWLALGGAAGLLGAPRSNESPTFDGVGRAQTFERGLISWHPTIGPHEVHGSILARWLEVGREKFGYPITDESVCPDRIGRFNHFRAVQLPGRPESSIYFSPATGPHDIFGAIRDKWASMGFERSVLGYPLVSEHEQKGGGRSQRFERGVITWTNTGGPAEHEVSGDVVKFDSGQVNSDLAMNGHVQLVVKRDGSFSLTTHVHDSGFSNISYLLSAVLVTSAADGFSFQHSGHLQGTSGNPFGPQRDDDFLTKAKIRQ
jgi:uncharacterized protein with LGFP repeats